MIRGLFARRRYMREHRPAPAEEAASASAGHGRR